MLSLAVNHIDGANWTGGINYLRNLLFALNSLNEAERPQVRLLTTAGTKPESYASLMPYLDGVLTAPQDAASLPMRLLRRLRRSRKDNRSLERFLKTSRIDCLFGAESYGPSFALPVLTWLGDFQHSHHPEMFSDAELTQRIEIFSASARDSARIVVSSRDALNDFAQFAPEQAHKGRVLSFVAQVPADIYETDPAGICREYDLPERFFYLPNQFWKHKNHAVVIKALAALKQVAPAVTVVCTGNTHDVRHPGHFAGLLAEVARQGLRDRFILLGMVPHAHTFQLMRQSLAVLQSSLFEGWSTTVEEAKSVGKPMLLSSLRVHKEQAPPQTVYFDPEDAEALAQKMCDLHEAAVPGPNRELEEAARACLKTRTHEFGRTFLAIAREAAV